MTTMDDPLDLIVDDTTFADRRVAGTAVWASCRRHPAEASCECPLLDGLVVLYQRGYRLTRPETSVSTADGNG